MKAWTISFIGALGVYLLFAGETSTNEMICASLVAALTALWYRLIRQVGAQQFIFSSTLAKRAVRSLVGVCLSVARTGRLLGIVAVKGRSPGQAFRVPFHFGADDPLERTRRACAVLLASLAPDLFVVELDRTKGSATLHSIGERDSRPDPDWLQ